MFHGVSKGRFYSNHRHLKIMDVSDSHERSPRSDEKFVNTEQQ